MNEKQMDRLIAHCNRYFQQTDCMVLHQIVDDQMLHIDVLKYPPTEKYPFWKLVTMGASDYKMPRLSPSIANRNEYILFVDKDVDLNDPQTVAWYHAKLKMVALYAPYARVHMTYGHSMQWENDDPDEEMLAAFLEFPQIIEDIGILRFKRNWLETAALLQVVLLNQQELDRLLHIGPQAFSNWLYPEDDGPKHFLSEKVRSDRF